MDQRCVVFATGALGFEPGNGGIKIRVVIEQFQCAFGKSVTKRSRNGLPALSKWKNTCRSDEAPFVTPTTGC